MGAKVDELEAMRVLVQVVEGKSFSEAARRLGVAVSSVSRLIDALERDLRVQLLQRSTRSIALTDAGRTFYDQALRILEEVELARSLVAGKDARPTGVLRVSAPVAFTMRHIVPHVAAFLSAHRGLQLDISLSDVLTSFADEGIDVAVRIGAPDEDPNVVVRRLASNRRVICASARYLKASGTPRTPDDVSSHACLLFAYASGRRTWRFRKNERDDKPVEIRVSGVLRANNAEVLRRAALDGLGLALLPLWLVRDDLRSGRLKPVLEDFEIAPGPFGTAVYAAFPPERRRSIKVHCFVDYFAARLQRLDAT